MLVGCAFFKKVSNIHFLTSPFVLESAAVSTFCRLSLLPGFLLENKNNILIVLKLILKSNKLLSSICLCKNKKAFLIKLSLTWDTLSVRGFYSSNYRHQVRSAAFWTEPSNKTTYKFRCRNMFLILRWAYTGNQTWYYSYNQEACYNCRIGLRSNDLPCW